jgi:hypothetical protein
MVVKFLFFILFLCSSVSAAVLEGAVIVQQAPIFYQPNDKTPVIQWVNKGTIIKLHPEYGIRRTPDDPVAKKAIFLKTIDKMGRVAYIKASHVEIFFETAREIEEQKLKKEAVAQKRIWDETDYRIQEPLPDDYPFHKEKNSATLSFFLGKGYHSRQAYPFNQGITEGGADGKIDVLLNYCFQHGTRTCRGFSFQYSQLESSYTLVNRTATEKMKDLSFGLYFLFTALDREKFSLGLDTQLRANIHYSTISQKNSLDEDQKRYIGYSPGLMVAPKLTLKHVVGKLDFVLMTQAIINGPYHMKSGNDVSNNDWWNNPTKDSFSRSLATDFSVLIGAEYRQ